MKADNILQTIGRTPHVRINRLFAPPAQVWLKLWLLPVCHKLTCQVRACWLSVAVTTAVKPVTLSASLAFPMVVTGSSKVLLPATHVVTSVLP